MEQSTYNVVIAGGGVMGRGIALCALSKGGRVTVIDPNPAAGDLLQADLAQHLSREIKKGRISPDQSPDWSQRLRFLTAWEAIPAHLFVEAVLEDIQVKHEVFALAEQFLPANAVLTSNTSTLPIGLIGQHLARPGRLAGMHFFNPATLMPLVEVIGSAATSPETLTFVTRAAIRMGKTPVTVKDTPGFIVNRAARFFYLESLRIAEQTDISPAAVDELMRATGFRMGPFELMDLIGIDTNHAVSHTLFESFGRNKRYQPSTLQQAMVDQSKLGRKSGQGFYPYPS